MKFRIIILLVAVFTLNACNKQSEIEKPKNVILLIGDGTGLTQISTAFYFKETAPNYAQFNHIGFINTSSSSHNITDSAAGATAFACGVKTYNGAIGMSKDSSNVENIVEVNSLKNINNGVIATSSITHATPASFYAHVENRGMAEDIALGMLNSEIDFFAGGGIKYFSKRKDQRNLIEELSQKDFRMDTVALSDFEAIKNKKKAGFLLAKQAMPKMSEGRGDFLEKSTELGTKFLSKNNANFFLMVEGSQVDWGGHENDGDYVVQELIDFDNAIGKALEFAKKDGNTLVIVTGDHETGGLALTSKQKVNSEGKKYNDYNDIDLKFSTNGHSTTLIPVFAFGPGAEAFNGIYQNNDIYSKIRQVTGW